MTTEICKHCNGWRGLHKWDTMQCPYMGTENENWQATTYEEADETAAVTITAQAARISELEARVKELEAGLGQVINRCEKAFKDTGYPAFFHDGTLSTARALLETNDRR